MFLLLCISYRVWRTRAHWLCSGSVLPAVCLCNLQCACAVLHCASAVCSAHVQFIMCLCSLQGACAVCRVPLQSADGSYAACLRVRRVAYACAVVVQWACAPCGVPVQSAMCLCRLSHVPVQSAVCLCNL